MEKSEKYKNEVDIKDLQRRIYNHYGFDSQLEKLEEECLELALTIKQRKKFKGERYIDVIEEMADVLNLIEQFKDNDKCFSNGIDSIRKYKVNREIDRIEKRQMKRL